MTQSGLANNLRECRLSVMGLSPYPFSFSRRRRIWTTGRKPTKTGRRGKEAARYRIFNAATNAAEAADDANDETSILPSFDQRSKLQKPPPLRPPGTRFMLSY